MENDYAIANDEIMSSSIAIAGRRRKIIIGFASLVTIVLFVSAVTHFFTR